MYADSRICVQFPSSVPQEMIFSEGKITLVHKHAYFSSHEMVL